MSGLKMEPIQTRSVRLTKRMLDSQCSPGPAVNPLSFIFWQSASPEITKKGGPREELR